MYSRQLAIWGRSSGVQPSQPRAPLQPRLDLYRQQHGTVEKSDGSGVTDIITTDVQWVIDSANTYPGVQTRYQIKRGSIQWEERYRPVWLHP